MADEAKVEKPGYLLQYTKQTSMAGEMVTINTNLPFGATSADIGAELVKISDALDIRTQAINDKVNKRTGKNLAELGVEIPGFNAQLPSMEEESAAVQ